MTAVERLHERQRMAKRLSDLYLAEYHGLLRSEFSSEPLQFSHNWEFQSRFALGFREGLIILTMGDDRTEVPHVATR